MKKLIITTAIVLGFGLTTFANPNGGGVFGRGESTEQGTRELFAPKLPSHGQNNNQPAPLGSGIALLAAFGAGYGLLKKREQSQD